MSRFGWYRPWLSSIQGMPLPARAKALAAVLARCERVGVVKESSRQLGQLASMDERTVRRALHDLEVDGWLRYVTSPTRQGFVISLIAPEVRSESPDRPDTESAPSGHEVRTGPDTESASSTKAASTPSPLVLPDAAVSTRKEKDTSSEARAA